VFFWVFGWVTYAYFLVYLEALFLIFTTLLIKKKRKRKKHLSINIWTNVLGMSKKKQTNKLDYDTMLRVSKA
jgi:hypothetical protein